MSAPKYNLIYYKALIDKCFVMFFDEHNDLFQNIDGIYVLSKDLSPTYLKRKFKCYLVDCLKPMLKKYSILEPEWFFVIGAGMPKDNLLLKYKDGYFPEKLQKLIEADFPLKYVLKEKDIRVDLVRFNSILIELFNDMFKSTRNVLRTFGSDMHNLIFIQHKNLDCYSMFKTIKFLYGKSNCHNLWLEKMVDEKSCLIAVNDLIDRYVQNKVAMNKSKEFKQIVTEVHDFIEEKIIEVRKQCL